MSCNANDGWLTMDQAVAEYGIHPLAQPNVGRIKSITQRRGSREVRLWSLNDIAALRASRKVHHD